ncbi:MAG TPA: 4-hydroxyphenylacetate 3-hydroxylase N-terminal domain-containing protein [Dehalococcoidia bacterium]|nr:4-hydroxyphenylacetate 3-hydroxylase N-terminal domain-containing protein [Dehalococcoidia bacterium]
MVRTDTKPLGAMTGARYIESLRDGREVWLDGKRVDDVTTHPAFRDMIKALADVYDLQNSDKYRDEMTYVEPESGLRTSLSWLIPKDHEDSARKRRNSQLWNMLTWGQLGRSPDILAPYISNMVPRREQFSAFKNPHCDFGENILNYYRYCRDNDLFLTHALGDPQVDRSTQPQNERRAVPEDEEIALHVVEETPEGVIVSGGKQLSTAAVHSNECYVSLSATFFARNDPRFVLAFSIPSNSKGLKILAREPVGRWFGSWGHPFLMLDEQDCMLFFDRVLVPWDRIFFLYESPARVFTIAGPGGADINFAGWANLERAHYRLRLMTAVATMVAEAIGVIEYREVAGKLGEMAANCEMFRLAMDGVEHSSQRMVGMGPMGIWMAQTSKRMVELLREICGSGIVMQPSENDLANPELRPFLEQFMRGKDVDVEYKSRLFRFAHDLAMSSFGMRQDIYEYWHGGDPSRNRINLLRGYNQTDIMDRIKEMCSQPLPHGEVP